MIMGKKYKLTSESRVMPTGEKVYRIKALKDFDTTINRRCLKGDKGGWVQSEGNLSHDGTCWLFDEAVGYQNSRREDDSVGYDYSQQYGNSWQSGSSCHFSGEDTGDTLDLVTIERAGKHKRHVTLQPDGNVAAGCFIGSFKKFKKAVKRKYGEDYGEYAYCIKVLKMTLKERKSNE